MVKHGPTVIFATLMRLAHQILHGGAIFGTATAIKPKAVENSLIIGSSNYSIP